MMMILRERVEMIVSIVREEMTGILEIRMKAMVMVEMII